MPHNAVPRAAFGRPLERGVWKQAYLHECGYEILVAVDRRGRRVDERLLTPDQDEDALREAMRRRLDDADPVPQLALVRESRPLSAGMSPGAFVRMIGLGRR